jgi:LacI family transcriptional regulator
MTRDLLNLPEPPTAIYATNNELTIGCVKHLNECGITPGKNISFIGFDNLTLAQSVYPRLTVVVQPVDEIGKMAANILLTRISGEAPSGVIRLDATLYDYDTVINIK